jgi:uncharacterized protein
LCPILPAGEGRKSKPSELRRFIEVDPILDFKALQPGAKATSAIRQAATDLNFAGKYGANVALTGPVPLNDDHFSIINQNAFRDTMIALVGTMIVLWIALRSWKIIASVFFNLAVGLALTAALGLAMVGAFNLISIAFFVLFVGLGVDFGIQLCVIVRNVMSRMICERRYGTLLKRWRALWPWLRAPLRLDSIRLFPRTTPAFQSSD